MHRYSWPGQRSSVSNVTPIHMPPDPMPMSTRDGRCAASESPSTKPSAPSATTTREPARSVFAPTRRTAQPATANPATMPAGKDATNRPIVAGPFLVIGGSLWIMANLSHNMMPMDQLMQMQR